MKYLKIILVLFFLSVGYQCTFGQNESEFVTENKDSDVVSMNKKTGEDLIQGIISGFSTKEASDGVKNAIDAQLVNLDYGVDSALDIADKNLSKATDIADKNLSKAIDIADKHFDKATDTLLNTADKNANKALSVIDKNLTKATDLGVEHFHNASDKAREAVLKQSSKTVDEVTSAIDKDAEKARTRLTKIAQNNINELSKDVAKTFEEGGKFDTNMRKSSENAGNIITNTVGEKSSLKQNVDNMIKSWVNTFGWDLFLRFGTYLGLGIGAIFVPSLAVRYAYHYFINQLKTPRVIIETSIGSWGYEKAKRIFRFKPRIAKEKFEDMILAPDVKNQINELVAYEIAHKDANEPFDNILCAGPAGTGKTMFAKAIAALLGMDYVVLTGSSFFQENAGVKAIDYIFGTLTKGRKLVIFIDEIDSLIASRSGKDPDGDGYRILNQLLNYTGTPSKSFILIGATNHPELIDEAFHRRFQHVVEMPLPGLQERIKFFTVMRDTQLINKGSEKAIRSLFTMNYIVSLAEKTEGLSYAELQTCIDLIKSASRQQKKINDAIVISSLNRVLNKKESFNKVFLKK